MFDRKRAFLRTLYPNKKHCSVDFFLDIIYGGKVEKNDLTDTWGQAINDVNIVGCV